MLPFRLDAALNGPFLYAILAQRRRYEPNPLEWAGNAMFYASRVANGLLWSTGIFLVPYLATKIPLADVPYYFKWFVLYQLAAYSLRTAGRLSNSDYRAFIDAYAQVTTSVNPDEKAQDLRRRYDYQITESAPVSFVAKPNPNAWYLETPKRDVNASPLKLWFLQGAAYAAVHTFGRRMLYPGSFDLLKSLLFPYILEQRLSLILEKNGKRVQLRASDNNVIDAIFFDRREVFPDQPLIICCDGNGGYYETGVARTPIGMDFSVLAFNPPGFSESTGQPYPVNVLNSMDAVMQYAFDQGFAEEDIVIFGWSIGGFPATWAAANYPRVRGLILDASFDDVLPLALAVMPSFASDIVKFAVQEYFNLDVLTQLNRYKGPVRIIRRYNDDVVTTYHGPDSVQKRRGNRGNFLLAKFLQGRYPEVVRDEEDVQTVLDFVDANVYNAHLDVSKQSRKALRGYDLQYILENSDLRAHLIRLLCHAHFYDSDSTHVTPLKTREFRAPERVSYTDLDKFLNSFGDL